ncbi:MAG: hypothetical protein QM755_01910 [Luteolibacter sp.]
MSGTESSSIHDTPAPDFIGPGSLSARIAELRDQQKKRGRFSLSNFLPWLLLGLAISQSSRPLSWGAAIYPILLVLMLYRQHSDGGMTARELALMEELARKVEQAEENADRP